MPQKQKIKKKKCTNSNCRKEFIITDKSVCPYCGKKYPRLINIKKNNTNNGKKKPVSSKKFKYFNETEEKNETENLKTLTIDDNLERGSLVTFGRYPQTKEGNDRTPIIWEVLDVEGGKALLFSKYVLDCMKFHQEWENVSWETCDLRKELNSNFLDSSFNGTEKSRILTSTINNENTTTGIKGNETQDKLFLLSKDEIKKYFTETHQILEKNYGHLEIPSEPTEYALAKGVDYTREELKYFCNFWLRTTSDYEKDSNTSSRFSYITFDYFLGDLEPEMDTTRSVKTETGVRPAMWITLKNNERSGN